MSIRRFVVLGALWVMSLAAVGIVAAAQTRQSDQAVISGNDIGFRPDGVQRGNRLTGTFMVRINGQWIEAQSATKVGPASH